jgi:hypothetical protein
MVFGGSVTARLTSHLKVMAELMSAGSLAGGHADVEKGALLTAGLRFQGRTVAVDVGLGSLISGDGYAFPLPFISGTVRL